MARKILLVFICTICVILPLDAQIEQPTWHLPGDRQGNICVGCGLFFSGTIEVSSGESYLVHTKMHSPFNDGGFHLGSAKFPTETFYESGNQCSDYKPVHKSAIRVSFGSGEHVFSVLGTPGTPNPACYPEETVDAGWFLLNNYYWGQPRFGIPQVTQKGNNSPYADGTKTIAQRGCCICSMKAVAMYLMAWGSGGTIEDFNDRMVANNGYAVRDVRMPKAAWLLGIKYLGSRKYDQDTITKLLGQGYALAVKVKVPR